MSGDRVRARVVVSGLVQGVWFRDSCSDQARATHVHGWVQNRSDGAVEAEFEGAPAAVERMIAWCRIGPPRARVDDVQVELLEPVGHVGFHVR